MFRLFTFIAIFVSSSIKVKIANMFSHILVKCWVAIFLQLDVEGCEESGEEPIYRQAAVRQHHTVFKTRVDAKFLKLELTRKC